MRITLIYFSVLQKLTGKNSEQLQIKERSTGEDLLLLLCDRYPELTAYKQYLKLAVNQEYQGFDTHLRQDDEVVLITPVSGG